MPSAVHTIYVPAGWSVEQVWEAIKRGDKVPVAVHSWGKGSWVNVDVDGKLIT